MDCLIIALHDKIFHKTYNFVSTMYLVKKIDEAGSIVLIKYDYSS